MPRSVFCLLLLALSACGQSGALYLPDQEPKAQAAPGLPTPKSATAEEDQADKQNKLVPEQP